MQIMYHIEKIEEIIGYDEYLSDFEALAKEYCAPSGTALLLSVFEEFTPDMDCGVSLDAEQTKSNIAMKFTFRIDTEEGTPKVAYTGYY